MSNSLEPDISVVIPVYRNGPTLIEINNRIKQVFSELGLRHEVIFVEDACPEDSLLVLQALADQDEQVSVISLTHNVGQQRAILIGMHYVRGAKTVIMDADLQDTPEAIPSLLDQLTNEVHVVFATRQGRYGASLLQHLTSHIFKTLMWMVCGVPRNAGLLLIMDQPLKNQLLRMNWPKPYILGMIGCARVPMTSIAITRPPRPIGQSAYTVRMRLKLAYTALSMIFRYKILPSRLTKSEQPEHLPVRDIY